MKALCLIFAFGSASAFARSPHCALFPAEGLKGNRLSAEFRMGADLAREFVRENSLSGISPTLAIVASAFHFELIDTAAVTIPVAAKCESIRGDELALALNKHRPLLAGFPARWHGVQTGCSPTSEQLLQSVEEAFESHSDVVTMSMDPGEEPEVAAALARLAESGSLLVFFVGGGFPAPLGATLRGAPGIKVTTLCPSGMICAANREGPEVDLAVATDDLEPNPTGTAALAQASAALGLLASWLPGISVEEARAILVQTALSSINGQSHWRRNGAGLLNPLAVAWSAFQLRQRGWPASRTVIPKLPIPQLPKFSASGAACPLAERVKSLRRQYHLRRDEEARRRLTAIYRANQLAGEADYLETLGGNHEIWLHKKLAAPGTDTPLEAIRTAAGLGRTEWITPYIDHALRQTRGGFPDVKSTEEAIAALGSLHDPQYSLARWGPLGIETVQWLIDVTAPMGRRDYASQILHAAGTRRLNVFSAVRSGQLEVLKLFLERGVPVEPNPESTRSLVTALKARASRAMVKFLIGQGARVNGPNASGETPLMAAVNLGDSALVRLLLEKGADPQEKTVSNQTALERISHNAPLLDALCEWPDFRPHCESLGHAKTSPTSP